MITMRFYRNGCDKSLHMEFSGHAGAAPKGEDLVCAAATMLTYTAAQAVQFLYEQGKLRKPPRIVLTDGSACVVATPLPETEAETMMVFWVVQAGAHVLARNYPQNAVLEALRLY